MAEVYEGRVLSSRPVADNLTALDIDVQGTPLGRAHLHPGQYGVLSIEGAGQGFFAIASAPDGRPDVLEFLVKGGSPIGDALSRAPVGSAVRVSAPMGTGFPLDRARGKSVLLIATGSGISPIRSLIETMRRDRTAYRDVTLYFGARTPTSFAYAEEIEAWQKDGIRVVQTVSRPGDTGWTGLTGYVQTHLPTAPVEDAIAFLCGQREMVEEVTAMLVAAGLPSDHVFLNF